MNGSSSTPFRHRRIVVEAHSSPMGSRSDAASLAPFLAEWRCGHAGTPAWPHLFLRVSPNNILHGSAAVVKRDGCRLFHQSLEFFLMAKNSVHKLVDSQAVTLIIARQFNIANAAGGGAGASVSTAVNFQDRFGSGLLPGNAYCVHVTPSQPSAPLGRCGVWRRNYSRPCRRLNGVGWRRYGSADVPERIAVDFNAPAGECGAVSLARNS
jgi:hypothetical protein